MLIETGAEDHLRHALDQRPSLIQRIALKIVLRAVRRQQARAAQPTEAPRLVDSEAAVAPQHPVPEERRAAAGG